MQIIEFLGQPVERIQQFDDALFSRDAADEGDGPGRFGQAQAGARRLPLFRCRLGKLHHIDAGQRTFADRAHASRTGDALPLQERLLRRAVAVILRVEHDDQAIAAAGNETPQAAHFHPGLAGEGVQAYGHARQECGDGKQQARFRRGRMRDVRAQAAHKAINRP